MLKPKQVVDYYKLPRATKKRIRSTILRTLVNEQTGVVACNERKYLQRKVVAYAVEKFRRQQEYLSYNDGLNRLLREEDLHMLDIMRRAINKNKLDADVAETVNVHFWDILS